MVDVDEQSRSDRGRDARGLLLAQVRRDGKQLRHALSGARAALTAARA